MTAGGVRQAFGGIDILRFLAAVAVALYHYCFWIWAFPNGLSGRAAGVSPQEVLGSFFTWGWVGVQIFFVISGFVIAFSAEASTPARFALARFKRLVPAVIICAPITAVVLLAMNVFSAEIATSLTLRTLAFVPFGPWVDSVYWTLGVEVSFYILIWGLLLLGKPQWIEGAAVCIGLVSTVFWLAFFPLELERFAKTRILDLLLVHHGCFFAIGVLLWAIRTKGFSKSRGFFAVLFNLAGILQIINSSDVMHAKVGVDVSLPAPILAYVIAMVLVTISLWRELTWSGWRKIGLATYPLYLIHNAVGGAIIGALYGLGMPFFACAILTLLLAIVFSCFVALHLEPLLRAAFDRIPDMFRRLRASSA